MKKLFLFLITLIPILGYGQCVEMDTVYSSTEIKQLENKSIIFGLKSMTEEVLQDKGFSLCSGEPVSVNITYLGVPENTFRIAGFAISNKITEVKVTISVGKQLFSGSGRYKTQAKTMLLELENGVPFQQTTLSTALKLALYDAFK